MRNYKMYGNQLIIEQIDGVIEGRKDGWMSGGVCGQLKSEMCYFFQGDLG